MLHKKQLFISRLFITIVLTTALLNLSGCINTATFSSNKEQSKVVWEARDQFVKIVPTEKPVQQPNQHPFTFKSATLIAALESIEISRKGDLVTSKTTLPLLDKKDLDRLAKNLTVAFAQATSEQDIVFAVHTIINGYKFGLEKVSVSGRAFYAENKLNIILGDLFVSVLPEEFYTTKVKPTSIDRSINPHKLGSRTILSNHKGYSIKPPKGTDRAIITLEREDWVSFNHLAQSIAIQSGQDNNKTTEERLISLKKLRDKKLVSKEEYRTIREKILNDI